MATDFKIRQGLSTELFESDGKTVKPGVILELGSWYLCMDTVSIYICVKKDTNKADTAANRTLKRANTDKFDSIEDYLETLAQQGPNNNYIKIETESELPNNFDDLAFDPNIAYYIVTDKAAGFISLYVFDKGSQQYVCTNKADMSVLEAKIDEVVDVRLEEVLDDKLSEKVPAAVKTTIETQILFGGNSTTTTADDNIN